MYKLILYLMLTVFAMTVYALEIDEQISMNALFQGKHGVDRAVHAAAQQTDAAKLARGIYSIDPLKARLAMDQYLQSNLSLDAQNRPLPGTFLQSPAVIEVFKIVNENENFPYTYTNAAYGYTVTLKKPGVILIVRMEYPGTYKVLQPIVWHIKGAAEIVY